ncbi:hypothetical protein [Amycolatopsis sp. lyj-112]|uniref:hypothetical protein n=1 Tax=Amycolatopsis sp. lyj-112 TaxID=2789288 RepID=UPI00397DE0D1
MVSEGDAAVVVEQATIVEGVPRRGVSHRVALPLETDLVTFQGFGDPCDIGGTKWIERDRAAADQDVDSAVRELPGSQKSFVGQASENGCGIAGCGVVVGSGINGHRLCPWDYRLWPVGPTWNGGEHHTRGAALIEPFFHCG